MKASLFFSILFARKWIILATLAATVLVTLTISLLLPPRYLAKTELVLDVRRPNPVSGMFTPQLVTLGDIAPGYLATQVDIIGSHNVALKVIDMLGLDKNPITQRQFYEATKGSGSLRDWLADLLLPNLTVKPARESNIIEIRFVGNDPKFAAIMANSFAQAYIKTNLELRVIPARETSSWFDEQVQKLREDLEKAQANLSSYQREHGIIAVDERIDVENARLAEISNQLVALQSMTFDNQSRERRLQETTARGESLGNLPEVLGNPFIQTLKSDLAVADSKLAELGKRLGTNHPDYQRALSEEQSLKNRLEEESRIAALGITSNARVARQRESEMSAALEEQKQKILLLKEQRDTVTRLSREVDNAQHLYDAARQRGNQSRLEGDVNMTDAVVLNPAIAPTDPSSPRVLLNVLIATMLGVILGTGLAFAIELYSPRVRLAEDLADALAAPLLGVFYTSRPRPSSWWSALAGLRWRPARAVEAVK